MPDLIRSLADLHIATTALAVLGLAISIVALRISALKRIPAPLITGMRQKCVHVVLCDANARVAAKLKRAEVIDREGVFLLENQDLALAKANELIAG